MSGYEYVGIISKEAAVCYLVQRFKNAGRRYSTRYGSIFARRYSPRIQHLPTGRISWSTV
eukprot:scaffold562710_cov102-Attheya_sp.AAC.1